MAWPRSGHADQAAAATAGLTHRFVRTVHGTPGDRGRARPDEGGYGIALATSRPVLEWHELRMSPAPGRYPLLLPTRPPRLLMLPDEPRAAVAAVLASPRLTVACTHLSFVPGVNAVQLRRVCAWLAELPGPRILLGDLNLPPLAVRALTRDWQPLVAQATYPAFRARVQLDHVLAHGLPTGTAGQAGVAGVAGVAGGGVRLPLSDHLGLAVELPL